MRRFVAVSLVAASLSGCATIMHGSNQPVGISSSPTGAQVFVDNQPMGITPVTATLSRKDHHTVRVEMAGYAPYEMKLTRGVSGWVWGNLVFGGIPGLAIDAITGGLYKLTPTEVNATLARPTATLNGQALMIAVVLSADPSWEKVGQMEPLVAGN
ncbi:MAG TPA: PEGA domain-containing protein [Longimicrobium sp.]|nr:PEGA domain-containing protein [Longimicrobium sp.]